MNVQTQDNTPTHSEQQKPLKTWSSETPARWSTEQKNGERPTSYCFLYIYIIDSDGIRLIFIALGLIVFVRGHVAHRHC